MYLFIPHTELHIFCNIFSNLVNVALGFYIYSEGEWVMDTWTEVDHQYDRDQIGEDQTGILAGQTEEGEMVLMVHKGAILEGIVTVEWIVVHHPDLGIHPCLVEETTPPVLETSVEEVLRTG